MFSVSIAGMTGLFIALVALAVIPGVSVLTVSARAASSGFLHGALVSLGIVVGDLLFILLAVFGLVLLVEMAGDVLHLLKYVAGLYLLWLAVRLWRTDAHAGGQGRVQGTSAGSSFMAGLLITLADQKAIVFYLAFLPAFLDLAALTYRDMIAVMCITVIAVGGVKLGYAYLAGRAGTLFDSAGTILNRIAAGVLLAAGALVIARGWSA